MSNTKKKILSWPLSSGVWVKAIVATKRMFFGATIRGLTQKNVKYEKCRYVKKEISQEPVGGSEKDC